MAAQVESVVTTLHVTHLDFDIESNEESNSADYTRTAQALALVRSWASANGQPLAVSYTLPVLPTGLPQAGVSVLDAAASSGFTPNVVNIMTMDYGTSGTEMGTAANQALDATAGQVASAFGISASAAYGMLGHRAAVLLGRGPRQRWLSRHHQRGIHVQRSQPGHRRLHPGVPALYQRRWRRFADADANPDANPDPDPDRRFVRDSLEQRHRIRCGRRSLLQRRQLDREPVELRRGSRRRLRRLERKRFLLISSVVESGRADALAVEGSGLFGGDFGGPGQDLGSQDVRLCRGGPFGSAAARPRRPAWLSNLNDAEMAMRALVYHGPGVKAWEDVPKPAVTADTDAIVRVDATTICGTDLHILKGDVPAVTDGRILGHEAVGTVESVGSGVKTVKAGNRVLVSCISACGSCLYCRAGHAGQCLGGGGWILGHKIDGTQAEYVRVPFADTSTYPLPFGASDEDILMLADILPTGYEVGVLNGCVRPGDVVAVVGAGPIGLSAITGARLFSPSHIVAIDLADTRLEAAKQFGADVTVNNSHQDPLETIRALTDGLGANVAIEAVGVPATFELATQMVRPGGHIANIGVHGEPATLHLEELWIKNITITTGLVDAYSTPTLLHLLATRQIDAGRFVTHHFTLDEFDKAYDVFGRAAETGALKVVLSRSV